MQISRAPGGVSQLVDELRSRPQIQEPAVAKAILSAAHASHERCAEALGVHRVTFTRWVNGDRKPRGEMARAYAELLRELADVAAS